MECSICKKTYSRADSLKRHAKQHHTEEKQFSCHLCTKTTNRRDILKYHVMTHYKKKLQNVQNNPLIKNSDIMPSTSAANLPSTSAANLPSISVANVTEMLRCKDCQIDIKKKNMSAHLKTLFHKKRCIVRIGANVDLVKSAFNKNIATFRIKSGETYIHVHEFMLKVKPDVINLIKQEMSKQENALKVNFELFISYMLSSKQNEEENDIKNETKSFNSKYRICTLSTDLDEMCSDFTDILKRKSEEFQVGNF